MRSVSREVYNNDTTIDKLDEEAKWNDSGKFVDVAMEDEIEDASVAL